MTAFLIAAGFATLLLLCILTLGVVFFAYVALVENKEYFSALGLSMLVLYATGVIIIMFLGLLDMIKVVFYG